MQNVGTKKLQEKTIPKDLAEEAKRLAKELKTRYDYMIFLFFLFTLLTLIHQKKALIQ